MNRFGSNLNCTRRIKCKIKIKKVFKNGGQDDGQDGGSKTSIAND